jgi:uncharacterized phage-associated protein
MANYDAAAIANEFLKRRGSSAWPQQMFIQKLAYIANGWNLAINGEPLIIEEPEAWDNGPVYRSLWEHIRDYGYRGPGHTLTVPLTDDVIKADLDPRELAVVDHVWAKYGRLNAAKLSEMTHEPNTPWYNAYFGRGRNAFLDMNDVRNHYVGLAMAGRATSA